MIPEKTKKKIESMENKLIKIRSQINMLAYDDKSHVNMQFLNALDEEVSSAQVIIETLWSDIQNAEAYAAHRNKKH